MLSRGKTDKSESQFYLYPFISNDCKMSSSILGLWSNDESEKSLEANNWQSRQKFMTKEELWPPVIGVGHQGENKQLAVLLPSLKVSGAPLIAPPDSAATITRWQARSCPIFASDTHPQWPVFLSLLASASRACLTALPILYWSLYSMDMGRRETSIDVVWLLGKHNSS